MARVLVVDDDEMSRTILRNLLEKVGHQVVEAKDSDEGLKCFRQRHIDLVITDLFMPEIGGLGLMAQLKAEDEHVKMIAVSGVGLENKHAIFLSAQQKGAAYTLEKPIQSRP